MDEQLVRDLGISDTLKMEIKATLGHTKKS